jgi:hypothetical protein
MQSGDTVQVQQRNGGLHWVYAKVITANADGSAFVQINHPGNIIDGEMQFFGADQVRDKAAVQKKIDALPPLSAGAALAEKRSLQSQLEWLS